MSLVSRATLSGLFRGGGLLFGFGLALLAQTILPQQLLQGGLLYIGAAVVFISALGFSPWNMEAPTLSLEKASPIRMDLTMVAAILTGAVSCTIALILFSQNRALYLVDGLWLLSIIMPTVAAVLADRRRADGREAAGVPWTRREIGVLALLITLAAFLRLWRIWEFPGAYEDEVINLEDARMVLDGAVRTPFVSGNWSTSFLFHFGTAGLLLVGIDSFLALKLMGIIPGTLTVLFFYLLLRELFRWPAAPLGTALLAVSSWHLVVSRWGYLIAFDALLPTAALYLFLRAQRTGGLTDYAAVGNVCGIALALTRSSVFTPLLLAFVFVHLVRSHGLNYAKARQAGLLVALAISLLFFAPRGLYIVREGPDEALARQNEVFLFSEKAWSDLKQNPVLQVASNTTSLFLSFNYRSGYQARWNVNPRHPTLDLVTGALLVLGLACALVRIRHAPYLILLLTALLMVIPGSITLALDDDPVTYRIVGMVPAIFALAAIPVALLWSRRLLPKALRWAVTLALVVAAAALNYQDYFVKYSGSSDVYYNTGRPETWAARQITQYRETHLVYLNATEVYQPAVEILAGTGSFSIIRGPEQIPVESAPAEKDLAFVLLIGPNKWSKGQLGPALLDRLFSFYPQAHVVSSERDPEGGIVGVTVLVRRDTGSS